MFGGDSSNPMLSVLPEENKLQCHSSAMNPLKIFGIFPVLDSSNSMRNKHANAMNRCCTERGEEAERISRWPKLSLSLNKNSQQEEVALRLMNPSPVSTGLSLSYEEDDHSSSVSTATESISDNIKAEIDLQQDELDYYIQIQEVNFMKAVRELTQRNTISLLSNLEKQVRLKLEEKDMEFEAVNCRNKELVERLRLVEEEAQLWQRRAMSSESMVSILENDLRQAVQWAVAWGTEGYGDSGVDDAASFIDKGNGPGLVGKCMSCRVCGEEACVVVWPCRHLCLCVGCEGLGAGCPVCGVVKEGGFRVRFS